MLSKIRFYDIFLFLMLVDITFMGVNSIYFLMLYYLFFIQKKIIFNKSILLIFLILFFYSLQSLIKNNIAYTSFDNYQTGPLRPIFIYLTIVLELTFLVSFLRYGERKLNLLLHIFMLIFFIMCKFFGLLDKSYFKNESGIMAGILVFYLVELWRQRNGFIASFLALPILISTKSSLIVVPILYTLRTRFVPIIIFTLFGVSLFFMFFLYEVVHSVFISKYFLLIDPPAADNYGGRYWANVFYLQMLQDAWLLGMGLDSLNYYRAVSVSEVLLFDHGGSDLLKILSSFGVLGTLVLYKLSSKLFVELQFSRKYELDRFGALCLLALLFKGIGLFSTVGIMSLSAFILFKAVKE